MISGGPFPSLAPLTDPSMKAFAAAVYAFAVFTATFAAISLSLRFMSGYSAVRRYLADASYWIYLIHLPLVMAGQVLMLEVALPWWGKLGAVVGGIMVVSLLSYELLVRHTFVGKALNGRRVPWRKPSVPHAVPAE